VLGARIQEWRVNRKFGIIMVDHHGFFRCVTWSTAKFLDRNTKHLAIFPQLEFLFHSNMLCMLDL
jgi:hypothetical protein